MERLLPASRFLVILAVVGCLVAAAALYLYGLLAVVRVVIATLVADFTTIGRAEHRVVVVAERLAVDLIQLADVFLLGTVIYLVGLGLHLLFINPRLPDRPWIAVEDLDGLKEMLVRVIILLVGVTFLGSYVEHADDIPVMELSISAAIVVVAFSLVVLVAKLPDWSKRKEPHGAQSRAAETTSPAQE